MNIPIDAIANYIHKVYKPQEMSFDIKDMQDGFEYVLFTYFNDIDDKYIGNPQALDLIANKEKNLENEIRKDVESFFSTKTSGFDLRGFAPYKRHGLTIHVVMNRTPR